MGQQLSNMVFGGPAPRHALVESLALECGLHLATGFD